MAKAKIIWRASVAPSGRYRSFQFRGWPSAYYNTADERPCAQLVCKDDYRPARVKTGEHGELRILVADHHPTEPGAGAFVWRTIPRRAATLAEAKMIVKHYIDNHPELAP